MLSSTATAGMLTKITKSHCTINKCRENENDIRNKKLLENIKNKNHKEFWSEIYRVSNHNFQHPVHIDGKCEPNDICNLFSSKYKKILCKSNSKSLSVNIAERKKIEILLKFSY